MPYLELLLHLKNQGDAIASQEDDRLVTVHGHVYVRSSEGLELIGNGWRTKYIWVRF